MKRSVNSVLSRRMAAFCLAAFLALSVLLAACTGAPQSGTSGSDRKNESFAASSSQDNKSAESQTAESSKNPDAASAAPDESVSADSSSAEPAPEEPAALLTDASDAVWINDTVYDYQDIAPIWAADYSDMSGRYMTGSGALIRREAASANRVDLYELEIESYSPIDEYYLYLPADSDVWRFFHMPSMTASGDNGWNGETWNLLGTALPYLSGADGIWYGNTPAGREAPWDLLLFGSRVTGSPALVYDKATGISYLYVESQMGDCAMRQLEPSVLHKPYRANIEYTVNHEALPEDTSGLLLWQSVDETGGYYPQGTVYTPDPYVVPTKYSSEPVVFIGPDAKPLPLDREYTDAGCFSFGYAAVEADGKWGYIDDTGREVIPCVYDPAPDYGYPADPANGRDLIPAAYPSTCGTAVVFKDGKCGLISMDGTLLIGFGVFDNMAPAYGDQMWVKTAEGWRLLDLAALKTLM